MKKKLEEAEKAKDQVEQDDYDVRVAETEEALRVEVLGVCRTYYLQVWTEALNQAGVEASSTLRRAENVYYPPAICTSGPSSTSSPKADIVSKEDVDNEASPTKILPSSNSPPKDTEQAKTP